MCNSPIDFYGALGGEPSTLKCRHVELHADLVGGDDDVVDKGGQDDMELVGLFEQRKERLPDVGDNVGGRHILTLFLLDVAQIRAHGGQFGLDFRHAFTVVFVRFAVLHHIIETFQRAGQFCFLLLQAVTRIIDGADGFADDCGHAGGYAHQNIRGEHNAAKIFDNERFQAVGTHSPVSARGLAVVRLCAASVIAEDVTV